MIDHVRIAPALDGEALRRIRAEMRSAAGADAGVLGAEPGKRVASSARRTTRVEVSGTTRAEVVRLLEEQRPRLADHFGRALDRTEEPQFLRYGPGDYFVAHQDGNTPLIHDDSRFRRVSVVIFVGAPGDHSGGSLLLHAPLGTSDPPIEVEPEPGTLIAYPAETTHEVTPITGGERLTIVSWYRSGG